MLAPPEVAAASRTGWRTAPGDAAALAAALGAALDLDPAGRQALALRARRHVAAFSLAAMSATTLAVYAELLTVSAEAS